MSLSPCWALVTPFWLYLENLLEPLSIPPYIVKDLSHCGNLGQAFLWRNKMDLQFREAGVQLSLHCHTTSLTTITAEQTRKSKDARVTKVLEKLWENGDYPAFHQGDILDLRVNTLPASCAVPGINYGVRKKALTCSST